METLAEVIERIEKNFLPLKKSNNEVRQELKRKGFIYESNNFEFIGRLSSKTGGPPIAWLIGDNLYLVNSDIYEQQHKTLKEILSYQNP